MNSTLPRALQPEDCLVADWGVLTQALHVNRAIYEQKMMRQNINF